MKEQFIKMVKTKNYPVEWFYKYYHEKGGVPINIHIFMQWFQQLEFNQCLDSIAKSFGLSRLSDKDRALIAVYEA
jgi:hypothetical protein